MLIPPLAHTRAKNHGSGNRVSDFRVSWGLPVVVLNKPHVIEIFNFTCPTLYAGQKKFHVKFGSTLLPRYILFRIYQDFHRIFVHPLKIRK